jgi:hypothetical protein
MKDTEVRMIEEVPMNLTLRLIVVVPPMWTWQPSMAR